MQKSIYAALSLLLIASYSNARDNTLGIVGASITYGNDVFNSEKDAQFGATPNLFYAGDLGFIDGNLLNITPIPYLGISASWRFEEVADDITNLPKGIENRDGNPELGVTIGNPGVRLTYLTDIAGVHKGQEVQLHLAKTLNTPIKNLSITPFIEVDWRDKNLSQHLYGISVSEAQQSGLSQYKSSHSFVYKAGLINLYKVAEHWLIINRINIEHHDNDSPLIQRDLGWSYEVGLTYQFAGNQ